MDKDIETCNQVSFLCNFSLRDELKLTKFIGDEGIMSKRKLEEIEVLEGIGDVGEVPEGGLEVEETPKGEPEGLEADEEIDEEEKGEDK